MTEPYKHCEYCNIPIKYQNNWIRHEKSKRHLKNIEKINESKSNNTINIPSNTINIPSRAIYGECRYCDKDFKYQSGLSRHEKKCRKAHEKKEDEKDKLILKQQTIIEELRKQITDLKKENKELKVVNNITNNTINVNVIGGENLKGIMNPSLFDKFAIACCGDNYNNTAPCPEKAIEYYLNEVYINKPENHNIKYTNDRSNKCQIFKDSKWIKANINSIIIDRVKECPEKCEDMLEEYTINMYYEMDCKDKSLSEHQWYLQCGYKEQIDKFINNIESFINDNGIKKLTDIIDNHKTNCYNYTKK